MVHGKMLQHEFDINNASFHKEKRGKLQGSGDWNSDDEKSQSDYDDDIVDDHDNIYDDDNIEKDREKGGGSGSGGGGRNHQTLVHKLSSPIHKSSSPIIVPQLSYSNLLDTFKTVRSRSTSNGSNSNGYIELENLASKAITANNDNEHNEEENDNNGGNEEDLSPPSLPSLMTTTTRQNVNMNNQNSVINQEAQEAQEVQEDQEAQEVQEDQEEAEEDKDVGDDQDNNEKSVIESPNVSFQESFSTNQNSFNEFEDMEEQNNDVRLERSRTESLIMQNNPLKHVDRMAL
eukprot:CAMPEP_0114347206 /NCGR_PEP_ID=MMETSP0101-20121206/13717_1 /TAXON_ID=38822 ORGANISM="Pteridomonas danica, Strain PT" /NCGR_SAMPLE_ID=MMETSP0101 /ASSEMBLY_ACC=CAM_ASM_000211 /LENGTH=288 /DNA_ID=CAMNT_0001484381 /DNA_START=382 /DNA_END=1248 /DNA_ORIENTATION=+